MSRSLFAFMFVGLLLSMLYGTDVRAQATGASVSGTVTDEAGAPLPGATVMLKNESTGFETGTATNADGRYAFRQVPLGEPYALIVSFVGYETQRLTGYAVNLDDQLTVDAVLSEAATELDAVTATAPPLRARMERAGATTRISAAEVEALPAQGRDFANLADLAPTSAGGIGIGGHRTTSTNVRLDGASARTNRLGRTAGGGPYTLLLEAIREFEVVTNDYDVTQGRQGGGAIDVATKSGTNQFEGSLFTYHRNEALVGDPRELSWGPTIYTFRHK